MTVEIVDSKGTPLWLRLVIGRRPLWTLLRLAIWIGASVFVFKVVLEPIRVQGESMKPTCQDGSIHFIYRLAYKNKPAAAGDIVALIDPRLGKQVRVIKRVLALPGQLVTIKRGVIYIDHKRVEDPFSDQLVLSPVEIDGKSQPLSGELQLGADEYFAIGDNRAISELYRATLHGAAGKVLIVGKVVF